MMPCDRASLCSPSWHVAHTKKNLIQGLSASHLSRNSGMFCVAPGMPSQTIQGNPEQLAATCMTAIHIQRVETEAKSSMAVKIWAWHQTCWAHCSSVLKWPNWDTGGQSEERDEVSLSVCMFICHITSYNKPSCFFFRKSFR